MDLDVQEADLVREAADGIEVIVVIGDQEALHVGIAEEEIQDPAPDPPTEEETTVIVAEIAVTATTVTIVTTEGEEMIADVIHLIADVIRPIAAIEVEAQRAPEIVKLTITRAKFKLKILSTTALSKARVEVTDKRFANCISFEKIYAVLNL